MSWRFRRRWRLAPGLELNLGKTGASVSAGVRGAHVTVGSNHPPRLTAGLPGSGLSVTETVGARRRRRIRSHHHVIFWAIVFAVIGRWLDWW